MCRYTLITQFDWLNSYDLIRSHMTGGYTDTLCNLSRLKHD
ncbi:14820_t:CDS:2 [Acaulospora morrowiae]|uniref:14820_t:CDS:1 n=1 Tax=Acaulospora morrowiae TaxID=94023 RepID=A0A9N9F1A6_9GLOM|nr:14820_t:CDS:2 [Acaulospora morrowiae]